LVGEQLLQHTRRHPADRVANKIDWMLLVPLSQSCTAIAAAKAVVAAAGGVCLTIVARAALERVEYLARSVMVAAQWARAHDDEPLAMVPTLHPVEMPVGLIAEETGDEDNGVVVMTWSDSILRAGLRRALRARHALAGCRNH